MESHIEYREMANEGQRLYIMYIMYISTFVYLLTSMNDQQ